MVNALKIDHLSSEFAQIKELLFNLQPDNREPAPSGDCHKGLALRWLRTLLFVYRKRWRRARRGEIFFLRGLMEDIMWIRSWPVHNEASDSDSFSTPGAGWSSYGGNASKSFFQAEATALCFFSPSSKIYIEEFQRCWSDPKLFSYHTSDCRNLVAMQEAGNYSDHMAPIKHTIASLIVSSDEALRPEAPVLSVFWLMISLPGVITKFK